MSIAVGDIATYLDGQFHTIATAVGQDSDPLTGYQPDIDDALRQLGRAESELGTAVDDADRDAVFALSRYFALRRFASLLSDRVNTSTGKVSYNFSNQRDHVRAMMDQAARTCAALGYEVAPAIPASTIPATSRVKLRTAW